MMLDMKRTFDEVVEAHSTPEKAAQILANPFYQAVSSSFAGTQEYMAMEKLGQLRPGRREGTWDLIVVDTPPSRSALDFLDAPKRLGSLPRRAVHPAAHGAGHGRRPGLPQGVHRRRRRWSTTVLSKMLGGAGARRRADLRGRAGHDVRRVPGAGRRHLRAAEGPETAFVVVAAPERDALREAAYFVDRLDERGDAARRASSSTGCRGWPPRPERRPRAAAAEQLAESATAAATAPIDGRRLLRLHADLARGGRPAAGACAAVPAGHPGVPVVDGAGAATDIHDLEGLRPVGAGR